MQIQMRKACHGIRANYLREEMLKSVEALHNTEIRVGSFGGIERNSALIYVDFLETQIVGLLVSW